jgi:hypothetical protein
MSLAKETGFRTPTEHRAKGFGVVSALGQTFAQATHGFGLVALGTDPYYPFHNEKDYVKFSVDHDLATQLMIARSLEEEFVQSLINTNNEATTPELVTLGYWLIRPGWVFGFNVFLQYASIILPFQKTAKPFTADVSLTDGARNVYFMVNGARYHDATREQAMRDAEIRGTITPYGDVITVEEWQTRNVLDLENSFKRQGAPSFWGGAQAA